MDDCTGPLPPHAKEGLCLFKAGKYFECHEALELAWREETGAIRDLYRGILQAAVTYLHMRRGNYAGALKVSERCLKWLNLWPDTCRGVNVAKLRADLSRAVEEWQRLGQERVHAMDWSLLKPVEWEER
jgi:uncharacterized protein